MGAGERRAGGKASRGWAAEGAVTILKSEETPCDAANSASVKAKAANDGSLRPYATK